MTANTGDQTIAAQVRELREQLAHLSRLRTGSQPNLRDLNDCRPLTKVADGQVPTYDSASGTFKPLTPTGGGGGGPPPFSLPGAVATSTSGRWYPTETLTIVRMWASLTVAGSTTTTVALLRNGSSVATLNLVASDLAEGVTLSQVFTGPEVDYMQVQVTAAGTGAQNLVVQVS